MVSSFTKWCWQSFYCRSFRSFMVMHLHYSIDRFRKKRKLCFWRRLHITEYFIRFQFLVFFCVLYRYFFVYPNTLTIEEVKNELQKIILEELRESTPFW
jgi:hypothetical protein